jgi:hypothetical protein
MPLSDLLYDLESKTKDEPVDIIPHAGRIRFAFTWLILRVISVKVQNFIAKHPTSCAPVVQFHRFKVCQRIRILISIFIYCVRQKQNFNYFRSHIAFAAIIKQKPSREGAKYYIHLTT